MARVRHHVDSAAEAVHGGGHGVGVEAEVELVLAPRPRLGVEHLDGGAAREPTREAHHLVVRGVAGVEGQNGEQRPLRQRRERHPPPRRGAHDVERRLVRVRRRRVVEDWPWSRLCAPDTEGLAEETDVDLAALDAGAMSA